MRKVKRIRKHKGVGYKYVVNRHIHVKRPKKKTGENARYRSNGNFKSRGWARSPFPLSLTKRHKQKFAGVEIKATDAIDMERSARLRFIISSMLKWHDQSQSPKWLKDRKMMVYIHYRKARRAYRRGMLGEQRWDGVIETKEKARLPLQCWGLHELVVEVWRGIFNRGQWIDDTYGVRVESDGEDMEL